MGIVRSRGGTLPQPPAGSQQQRQDEDGRAEDQSPVGPAGDLGGRLPGRGRRHFGERLDRVLGHDLGDVFGAVDERFWVGQEGGERRRRGQHSLVPPHKFQGWVAVLADNAEDLGGAANGSQLAAVGDQHGQASGILRRAYRLEGANGGLAERLDGRLGDAAGLHQGGSGFLAVAQHELQGLGPAGDVHRSLFAVDSEHAGDLAGMGAGLLDEV